MQVNQNNTFGDNNFFGLRPQPRSLTDKFKQQLIDRLSEDEKIRIIATHGDREAYSFASSVKDFLSASGYQVNDAIDTEIRSAPILPQEVSEGLENGYRVLRIGSQQM